jgi:hypothetical protein
MMQISTCPQCTNEIKSTARFCPSCGAAVVQPDAGTQVQSADTEREFQRRKSPALRYILIGIFAIIGVYLIITVYNYIYFEEHDVIAAQPIVSDPVDYTDREIAMTDLTGTVEDGYFTFPLQQVLDHKLVRFEYQGPTAVIPILAYISTRGKLVTSISISEPSNSSRFTIINNEIHNNNCPSHWEIDSMRALACCGNNHPDPIPSIVRDGKVMIAVSTIENWRRRL